MLRSFHSIILRTVKYSESSLIVEALTREAGLQSFIVSGIRGNKSRMKASFFQIANHLEIVAYFKDEKKLNRIKEVRPYYLYESLPYQVSKSAVAQYFTELMRHTVKEPEYNPELFDFYHTCLITLDTDNKGTEKWPLYFAWNLTNYLGIQPEIPKTTEPVFFDLKNALFTMDVPQSLDYLDKPFPKLIRDLIVESFEEIKMLKIPKAIRASLLEKTHIYYEWHLDHFKKMRSPEILKTIFG